MTTRNVVLTEHQEELISSLVEAGKYQNASEVLRDGLRLLEREQREFEAKLHALREAVQRGWDDVEAGDYVDVTSEAEHVAMWDAVDHQVDVRRSAGRPRAR